MSFLAKNLRYFRLKHGLSQNALAKIFDITRGMIASYEGTHKPKIDKLVEIANYFDVDVEDFVKKDMTKPRKPYSKSTDQEEPDSSIPMANEPPAPYFTKVDMVEAKLVQEIELIKGQVSALQKSVSNLEMKVAKAKGD